MFLKGLNDLCDLFAGLNIIKIEGDIILPENITHMGAFFNECYHLKEIEGVVVIPETVIDCHQLFRYCYNLERLDIEIPSHYCNFAESFLECNKLNTVNLKVKSKESLINFLRSFIEDIPAITDFMGHVRVYAEGFDLSYDDEEIMDIYNETWDIKSWSLDFM